LERSNDESNTIKRLIKKYFEDFKIINALEKNIKNPPMMDMSLPMKIINTLSLVNGLLKNVSAGTKLSDIDYEKIIVYSISWAVGGLYEAVNGERSQFHEYLQSKNAPLPLNKK
jgi:dynein heavy chain